MKKWRGQRWRFGNQELLETMTKIPRSPISELDELWKSLAICHKPSPTVKDTRCCALCQEPGDGLSEGPSRLVVQGLAYVITNFNFIKSWKIWAMHSNK